MKIFDNKKIIKRYKFISFGFLLVGLLILFSAFRIMTVEKDQWNRLSESLKKDSVISLPTRGKIMSCDGDVLASSLPKYKIFMDFNAGDPATKDSVWAANLDSICEGLHIIFPERSAEEFRADLSKGKEKNSQHWTIWPRRIDYNIFKEVKALPVFRLSSVKGGFHWEEYNSRSHPFQGLASRTIGDMFAGKDSARCGLELSYDKILRGETGLVKRRKVMNRYLDIVDQPAIDGCDIWSTIDVNFQDLAEEAVRDKLEELGADVGVSVLMECKTGDIKAIVNLSRCDDGGYYETKNCAVSDLLEPGSVFKTASFMIALDDGKCDTNKMIATGCGIVDMHGAKMKDHNWHRGGYGTINMTKALEVSSNIGVSKVIDEYYHNNPQAFVDGLHRIGIAEDLNLPFYGSSAPVIWGPQEKAAAGRYWSHSDLAWMSIGYGTQIPPISTVTFYNAIANGGRMMRPRFVTKVVKDGETVKEFPPEVMKEKICKDETLKKIQAMLRSVVSRGLAKKPVDSKLFQISGKTGTAQISKGKAGYKGSGATRYLLSFVGYFPSDDPMYTCIVCIQKTGTPVSGGGMAGPVFKRIAEGVMAKKLMRNVDMAKDTMRTHLPEVKSGNMLQTEGSLSYLGITSDVSFSSDADLKQPVWGNAEVSGKGVSLKEKKLCEDNVMPDVTGMGARDAVYILEKRGLKVSLTGRGCVMEQTPYAGTQIKRGMHCQLKMM